MDTQGSCKIKSRTGPCARKAQRLLCRQHSAWLESDCVPLLFVSVSAPPQPGHPRAARGGVSAAAEAGGQPAPAPPGQPDTPGISLQPPGPGPGPASRFPSHLGLSLWQVGDPKTRTLWPASGSPQACGQRHSHTLLSLVHSYGFSFTVQGSMHSKRVSSHRAEQLEDFQHALPLAHASADTHAWC